MWKKRNERPMLDLRCVSAHDYTDDNIALLLLLLAHFSKM